MVDAIDIVREGILSGLVVLLRALGLIRVGVRDGVSRINSSSAGGAPPDSLLRLGITLPLMVWL